MGKGMLMGAIGGLAQGMTVVGGRMHEEDMKRMDAEIQAERERRVEEANIRAEGRKEAGAIRGEQRQMVNHKVQRQDDLDFATNPDNVNRVTEAGLLKQRKEDEYGDSRSDIEIQQAARKAAALDKATYHDNTDYEGRRLAHEKLGLEIDDMARNPQMNTKLSGLTKARLDSANKDIDRLTKAYTGTEDAKQKVQIKKRLDAAEAKRDALLGYEAESKSDPVGLAIRKDMLINKIKALKPSLTDDGFKALGEKQSEEQVVAGLENLLAELQAGKEGGVEKGDDELNQKQTLMEEIGRLTNYSHKIPEDATIEQLRKKIAELKAKPKASKAPIDETSWALRAGKAAKKGLVDTANSKLYQWGKVVDDLSN